MTQPALAPVSPEVRARRTRQNRIIVAVIVLVLVPVLSTTLANRYVDSVMNTWRAHPTFAFNTTSDVDLTPGDYVVWTFFDDAPCTVTSDGLQVATTAPPFDLALETQGIHPSAAFSVTTAGTYSVTCASTASSGYVMVSTPSPLTKATMVRLLGYVLAGAGIVTGLVLLILAIVANTTEKKARQPWRS